MRTLSSSKIVSEWEVSLFCRIAFSAFPFKINVRRFGGGEGGDVIYKLITLPTNTPYASPSLHTRQAGNRYIYI